MSTDNAQQAGRHQPPARRPIRSWQEAERNAAAWMRHWGYHDAAARPGGADGGVDVRSTRALGQVKFQAHAVGRPELQRLFGARGRHMDRQLLFFTGSSYASTAVEYAAENDIALFVYALDGAMNPVNAAARRISSAARKQKPAQTSRPTPKPQPARTAPPAPKLTLSKASDPSRPAEPAPPKHRPGSARFALGFILAVVALALPASDSFVPRPSRTVATAAMLVVPVLLMVWGVVEKTRRRFGHTALGLFLLQLPVGWLCNARLWQGGIALTTTITLASSAAGVLLLRHGARVRAAEAKTEELTGSSAGGASRVPR
ncbi:hypothetical protein SUDANB105_03588 [Streptomyces sp. enrichment culture]|uniref:restriction endonuclease n=1 Tax=Streptomyces sp. enrichment culture TaxID=1795815 RepID=UPI003F56168C